MLREELQGPGNIPGRAFQKSHRLDGLEDEDLLERDEMVVVNIADIKRTSFQHFVRKLVEVKGVRVWQQRMKTPLLIICNGTTTPFFSTQTRTCIPAKVWKLPEVVLKPEEDH